MELAKLCKKLEMSEKDLKLYGIDEEMSPMSAIENMKDYFTKLLRELDNLMHPDSNYSTMLENSFLQEEDHKKLANAFKTTAKTNRKYELAKLNSKELDWAKDANNTIHKLKSDLTELNEKLLKGWDKQDTKKQIVEYMG